MKYTNYATKLKTLSRPALQAFAMIAHTTIEKAEREQRIPERIRLWIQSDHMVVMAELTAAGIIEYVTTDKTTGQNVFDHIVDQEALAEALPHLRRH